MNVHAEPETLQPAINHALCTNCATCKMALPKSPKLKALLCAPSEECLLFLDAVSFLYFLKVRLFFDLTISERARFFTSSLFVYGCFAFTPVVIFVRIVISVPRSCGI